MANAQLKLEQIKTFVFGFMFFTHLQGMKQVTDNTTMLELENYCYDTYNKVIKYLKGQTTLDGKFSDVQLICAEKVEQLFGKFDEEQPTVVRIAKLVDGKIAANTVCPYRAQCQSAKSGVCGHKGMKHDVPYSCGLARAFELFGKYNRT